MVSQEVAVKSQPVVTEARQSPAKVAHLQDQCSPLAGDSVLRGTAGVFILHGSWLIPEQASQESKVGTSVPPGT